MNLGGRTFTISAGEHEATIVEVGAGLARYTYAGVDVTCSYPVDALPPKGCGATLVPWPNRIRAGRYAFDGVDQQLALTEPEAGNAIHGLGRWSRWSEVEYAADRVMLRLDVVPQKGYPFPIRVHATFALDPRHGLSVTIEARNLGDARAPFGAGSHPYLSTHGHPLDETTVQLPADEQLVTDDRGVPVETRPVAGSAFDVRAGKPLGEMRFDTGFTGLALQEGRGVAELRTPAGGAQLWFGPNYRFLQVFTLDALTPGQPGVAIEPMSCAPDAFNSGAGLVVLEPGGAWSGSWGITPL